jgi:hypothetical protein
MPRTMRAAGIRAWRMEQLIRDLALGEKSMAELAEIHGVEEQTVRLFKMRHKADIAAVLEDWSNKFDHVWSTKGEPSQGSNPTAGRDRGPDGAIAGSCSA